MEKEAIAIYPRKSALWIYAGISFAAFLLSIFVMLYLDRVQIGLLRLIALIAGLLGSLGSIYLLLFNIGRLKRTYPLLRTDPDGLYFHLSPLMDGKIPWEEIEAYNIARYAGRNFVLIQLTKPQTFLNRYNGLRKRRFLVNQRRFSTPIVIPAHLFPDTPINFLQAIRHWRTP